MPRVNIGIAGGSCTGKSTLAAALFARLKCDNSDYDLIGEESRKLAGEFGNYQSPFERFYMWRQQEREELRSRAVDGFVTDTPLFQFFASAKYYASEPRDQLAVRELHRMCTEVADRYQIIAMAECVDEIPYKIDSVRKSGSDKSRAIHATLFHLVNLNWPEKLVFFNGSVRNRTEQVFGRILELSPRKND